MRNPKVQNLIREVALLEKLTQEAERRHLGQKLWNYKPHEKQIQFHRAKAKYRLLTWGNQTGKTKAGCAEAIAHALGQRPWEIQAHTETIHPPARILIAGNDFVHAVSGDIWPRIEELAPTGSIVGLERIHSGIISKVQFRNGSFIVFMSYEQEPSKYEGFTWDFAMFNEPPPREIWVATHRGLMARSGRAIFCMTPLSEPWIYDEIYSKCGVDADYWQSSASIYDNPYLPKREKERFVASLTPEEREARVWGKFKHLLGRVFPEYDSDIHTMKIHEDTIKPEWPKGMCIDPHTRRPFAIAWFAVTPQQDIIFFKEWPQTPYYETTSQLSLQQYVELIRAEEASIPGGAASVVWRLMDPNFGRTPTVQTARSLEDEFGMHRLYFDTRIDNDIESGHIAIKQRLFYDKEKPIDAINRPTLYFGKHCRNLIQSFLHYQWADPFKRVDRDPRETPKEKWKDFVDVVRYTVIYNPLFYRKDLDRSYRQSVVRRLEKARSL